MHGCWHGELLFNGYRVSLWGDEKVLDIVVMVSQHVDVINATKMHNQNLLKWKILCCIYYTNKRLFFFKWLRSVDRRC